MPLHTGGIGRGYGEVGPCRAARVGGSGWDCGVVFVGGLWGSLSQ